MPRFLHRLNSAILPSRSLSRRFLRTRAVLLASLLPAFATAQVSVQQDVGFNALEAQLGAVPDGAGIAVMQTEGSAVYLPNSAVPEFAGKSFTDLNATQDPGLSSHATEVGRNFYGTTDAMTPGVTDIGVYTSIPFILEFLRYGSGQPLDSERRVNNNSWVGGNLVDMQGSPLPNETSKVLRRLDWVIARDEFIHAVGTINGSVAQPLLSTAYNVITVGRTDLVHAQNTVALDSLYVAGRKAIHLVVPETTTSDATPYVASAAVSLIDAANANPGWSQGSLSNRDGATIYHAETSEVIRAALMAGASRFAVNTTPFRGNVLDYGAAPHQAANGLDNRYGAGQLNIFNSYQILAAGEKASTQDGGPGIVGYMGFDYDGQFGGSSGSNTQADYALGTASQDQLLAVTLSWNLDVDGPFGITGFNTNATLHTMELELFDVTGGGSVSVASSTTTIDSTQTIWVPLQAGRDYALQVRNAGGNFLWDYGLAWSGYAFTDFDVDGEPDHIDTAPLDPCVPDATVCEPFEVPITYPALAVLAALLLTASRRRS